MARRAAVIGAGLSGLVAAYELARAGLEVVLYEKEDYLGGHSRTVTFNGVDIDLGFMLFNRVMYPNLMDFFENLGIEMEPSDMSFSVSLDNGQGCEWGSWNGYSSLFAQRKNLINPYFWLMIREIVLFKTDVLSYLEGLENNPDIDRSESLGDFIKSRGYSDLFQKAYLIPVSASMCPSCTPEKIMSLSAFLVLSFFRNHHLLQIFDHPQWLTVRQQSRAYVNKVREFLERKGCQIRTGCEITGISTTEEGCVVYFGDDGQAAHDGCVVTLHAPDALKVLGNEATSEERTILGAFQYAYSDIYLHRDKSFMPKNTGAWRARNFLGTTGTNVCLTYWLNVLQNIKQASLPFLVTFNPPRHPENTLLMWSTGHPIPSVGASRASLELDRIQGKRGIWYSGAYQGFGFHEDGLKAAKVAANNMIGAKLSIIKNPTRMVLSIKEIVARAFVTRFLGHFICTGKLTLLEEGGTIFTFEGSQKKCPLTVVLRIHSPRFYWKVMTEADFGLAHSYMDGDFSLIDKHQGLLNLFQIIIANQELDSTASNLNKRRGWWTPTVSTAVVAFAVYYLKHLLRRNTITQARRNIAQHYDLSNDMFALFLEESMMYSCAVFKSPDEGLNDAQMRKISLMIKKAKIEKSHEVLELGCGWGCIGIEVVKQTGCRYTGITLSKEQLKYGEMRAKEAGLQDRIRFLLCDYRELPTTVKYDRIIGCEVLECVGHEYMEEFFGCIESLLAEDGLLVMQFSSMPEQKYEENRLCPGFIKEYIFPGGCIASMNRMTTAMASASRLCVEHVENIGIHYYLTLRCWRSNFLEKQKEIMALGFDEKFIRTFEFYFDYCAAGFLSRTLGNYQVVYSRPGNGETLGPPYQSFPSAL
ncbi:hypothetical protein MLD38_011947 [Melastoma candidum]|uniref:Uncharacterized protein n=1 Tax=Melastoma candidum TaxID=119954 RepID=A0ACB9R4S4_9MYRT|nr:hypothetical protein MLD38_011947 [Melastoma candidum]